MNASSRIAAFAALLAGLFGIALVAGKVIGPNGELPTPGRYRLFLQFKHRHRIHTVAFTQEVK
ncbi:MAG: hypothetical protein JWQ20_1885 [Conexibacter sp.]|nr:hypothetical protein [Conexibacter sp.]